MTGGYAGRTPKLLESTTPLSCIGSKSTGSDNGATERFYGRVEEIWELDYSGLHNTTMFRVRWIKNVER